jgi:hypothetical protein
MKVAVDCERWMVLCGWYCVDGTVWMDVMLAMQNVCLLEEEAEQVVRQVCWDGPAELHKLSSEQHNLKLETKAVI